MKYCIVIPDGACDLPYIRTKNLTPLEVARTPGMDSLALRGRMGMVRLIPDGLPPESAVSTLSLLGYDPAIYYTGKASFEAMAEGIAVGPRDWVFSCDFVSTFEGTMADPRAGQIRTAEAKILIEELNRCFEHRHLRFHLGESYHHLLILENTNLAEVKTASPLAVVGKPLAEHYPQGPGSELLIEIMVQASEVLRNHEINKIRRELEENPADALWLWGGGNRADMPQFAETFGLKGGMISACPEVRGVGKAIGLDIIPVPNITGSWDTDYTAKAEYALRALETLDLVCVHIGALMAVSRYGEISQKVRVLEQIDHKVIKPLCERLPKEARIMLVAGHFISVKHRVGSRDAVPFAIWGNGLPGGTGLAFNERNAAKVHLTVSPGHELLRFFLNL